MATPAYLRIRTELEQRIRSGALLPGSKLPTEAELRESTRSAVPPRSGC
nr:GntR family transcriptional regulator [Saccharopolyspora aridisoli]